MTLKKNAFIAENAKKCKIKLEYSASREHETIFLARIALYRIKGKSHQHFNSIFITKPLFHNN